MRASGTLALAFVLLGCQAGAATGATCALSSECASGLVCRFGRCRVECVENRDCPVGASCLPSAAGGACAVETDLGCETGVGRACAGGLVCVADRCEATCTDAGDCPGDGACVTGTSGVSFCGRGARVDGGLVDAGPSDTGAPNDAAMPNPCARAPEVCMTDDGHGCALVAGGAVVCWGSDSGQRLGDGTTPRMIGGVCASCPGSATPVPVVRDGTTTPLTGMVTIACGGAHVCAFDAAGTMFCWGDDGHGQLGTGSSGAPSGAVRAAVFTEPVDRLALGRSHTCARDRSTHVLRCIGENRSGQIDPSSPDVAPDVDMLRPLLTPTLTPMGSMPVAALAAGGIWTCATTEASGDLHCWGWSSEGQTGGGTPGVTMAAIDPGTTTIATGVTSVAAGYETTCFVRGGAVECIGSDVGGSLGRATGLSDCTPGVGETSPCTLTPVVVQPGVNADAIVAGPGTNGFCALGGSGALCWGYNDRGQAGQPAGSVVRVALPPFVDAVGGRTVCRFGMASTVTCASLDDGRVLCAGDDHQGQLGDGTADDDASGTPTVVLLP